MMLGSSLEFRFCCDSDSSDKSGRGVQGGAGCTRSSEGHLLSLQGRPFSRPWWCPERVLQCRALTCCSERAAVEQALAWLQCRVSTAGNALFRGRWVCQSGCHLLQKGAAKEENQLFGTVSCIIVIPLNVDGADQCVWNRIHVSGECIFVQNKYNFPPVYWTSTQAMKKR